MGLTYQSFREVVFKSFHCHVYKKIPVTPISFDQAYVDKYQSRVMCKARSADFDLNSLTVQAHGGLKVQNEDNMENERKGTSQKWYKWKLYCYINTNKS